MLLLPLLLVLAQVDSKPPADGSTKVALKVGEKALVKKVVRVKCSVPAVVETAFVDGRYEVKALAPGTTVCTFQGTEAAKVIEYTVAK